MDPTQATAVQLSELEQLAQRIRPTVLSAERTLPVAELYRPLFPMGGLVRGTRIAVEGAGATSVAMSLLAPASQAGSWVAVVGIGSWGWAAAVRAGIDRTRTVVIDDPPASQWATAVAALVDSFDLVVVDPTHQIGGVDARRLAARTRERGSVVVSLQLADQRRRFRWPTEPDHSLAVSTTAWTGLEVGHGYLQERRMSVAATGRRGAVRERRVEVCIDAQGTLVAAAPERDATVRHLSRVS
ncbi:MAG TPA: hypothetical protein DEG43_16835 [Acidimicrobiaceae bacterium]|jgi:hypothetical protein|nr:hypothetical protein [Acidimicrobiaceae bacterium]